MLPQMTVGKLIAELCTLDANIPVYLELDQDHFAPLRRVRLDEYSASWGDWVEEAFLVP